MFTNNPIENWYNDTHQQSQAMWTNYTTTINRQSLHETNQCKFDKSRYLQMAENKESDVQPRLMVKYDENWIEKEVVAPATRSELFAANNQFDKATNDVTWNEQPRRIVDCDENWDDEEEAAPSSRNKVLDNAANDVTWSDPCVEYAQSRGNSDKSEGSSYLQMSELKDNFVQPRPIVDCDENWDDEAEAPAVPSFENYSTNKELDATWNEQHVGNIQNHRDNEINLYRSEEKHSELKENDVKSKPIIECDENWDDEEVAAAPMQVIDGHSDNAEHVQNCKVPGKRKLNDVFDINDINDPDDSSVFSDGYDEQLFGDANDREWLNRMSEMERETVLFQRSEARESLRNQWQIRHKLNQRKECFERRQAQLAQNGIETPRRFAMTELIDRRSKSNDKRFKVEANNSSGCYWQELPGYVTSVEQINQLRIARFKLERIVYWPMFEKTVLNCFVRVCIGNDPYMRPVYRIAEIVGFVERVRPYTLGTSITNVALRLKHGAQHHNFNMQVISNQPFTQEEFSLWQRTCIEEGVDMPSLSLIAQKHKLIEIALDYVPSEEVIQRMIEKKNRLRQKPVNITVHKACLLKERDAAIKACDFAAANALNAEIGELNDEGDDQTNRINVCPLNFINERNRQLNINAVDTKVENSQQSDPFTRRMTQPRLLSNPQDKCDNKPVELQKTTLKIRTPIKNQLPTFTTSGADLYDLHNFDIDFDLNTTTQKQ